MSCAGNAFNSGTSPIVFSPDEKTSVLLRRILKQLPDSEVRIGYVVFQLRRRSFGGLLIILAALSLLPGISLFAGLAMIVPGLQMAAGFRAPLLPRFIRRRQIDVSKLRAIGNKVAHLIEWSERFVTPRWLLLSTMPMAILMGVLVAALALVVILPLPFSNFPPAVALLCLSLGIMERDGLLILIGLIIAAIALTIGVLISYVAVHALLPML